MNFHKGVCAEYHKLRESLQMEKGDGGAADQANLRISQNAFINFYRSYELTHPNLPVFALASHVAKLWAKMNEIEKRRFAHDALLKLKEKRDDAKKDRKDGEANSSGSIPGDELDMGQMSLHVFHNAFSAPTINMQTYSGATAPPITSTNNNTANATKTVKPMSITQTLFKNLTANIFRTLPKIEGLVKASTDTLCSAADGAAVPKAEPDSQRDILNVSRNESSRTCQCPVEFVSEEKVPKTSRSSKPVEVVELVAEPCRTVYRRDAKTRARANLHKSIKDPYNRHFDRNKVGEIEEKKRREREAAAKRRAEKRDAYLRNKRDIPVEPVKVDRSRSEKKTVIVEKRVRNLKRNESSLGGKSFKEILAKLNKDIRQLKEKRKIYDSLCSKLRRRDAKANMKARSKKK